MSKLVKAPHEDITYRAIGAAMAVHRRIGPGHKESVYQRALEAELEKIGVPLRRKRILRYTTRGAWSAITFPISSSRPK
jgi:GxxExxY protein